jgi:hypothetical protein
MATRGKKIRQWHDDYAILQRQTGGEPAMSVRDGGRFLVVDQHFPDQPTVRHRLTGISAEIYRYCHIPRSLTQVAGSFTTHRPEQIRQFFFDHGRKTADVCRKRLLPEPGGTGFMATMMMKPLILAPLRGFTDAYSETPSSVIFRGSPRRWHRLSHR